MEGSDPRAADVMMTNGVLRKPPMLPGNTALDRTGTQNLLAFLLGFVLPS